MGSPKASDWFASVATSQQSVLQPVNLAIFTTSSLFNPLAVPAPHMFLLFLAHQPSPHYGRPLSVSGRPCYILRMFLLFYWPPYSPALVNGSSRKVYTWWTLSVIREVTTWIIFWSSLNDRVGQKLTKFGIFSNPTRKLSAHTPECGRIL